MTYTELQDRRRLAAEGDLDAYESLRQLGLFLQQQQAGVGRPPPRAARGTESDPMSVSSVTMRMLQAQGLNLEEAFDWCH